MLTSKVAGYSAVRLAHLVWDQGVVGSNPTTPTINQKFMELQIHPQAKALIFDLDGTLSDSLPVHIASWDNVRKQFNCSFDKRIMVEMTGAPTVLFAERIKKEQNLDVEVDVLVRMKHEEFRKNIHRIKQHDSVVNLMKSAYGKMPLAVGTGASRASAMGQLIELNLLDYFDCIVTADDVSRHKPEPDTFVKCAELMGVDVSNCQVFEDGELGMDAALSVGMILTDVRPFVTDPFSSSLIEA